MTQDERWLTRYKEVKAFIETNHRNPSKYNKLMVLFLKRGRKLMVHDSRFMVKDQREKWGEKGPK